MLVRIVKLNFKTENISSFTELFEETADQIRNFQGCQFLELYQDKHDKNIFFTYSHWDSEEALNLYRESEFFNTVWKRTKVLFDAKPEAWSVTRKATLK